MRKRQRLGSVSRICSLSGEPLEQRQCLASNVMVTLADQAVMEGESHQATVRLSAASSQVERVLVSLTDGTATYGKDYFGMLTQQLTYMPGQTSQTITIPTLRDDAAEGVETFRITATPVNPRISAGSTTARIVEYAPPEEISVEATSVVEGGDGSTATASFLVTLSGPSDRAVTVSYQTRDRTARATGGDYRATSGTLTFAPGETSKPVTVQVVGDDVEEGDETFELVLTEATNGRIGDAIATGTILDDDSPADVNQPGFQITLEFIASPFGEVPEDVRQIAQEAADRWSEIIVGDLPLVDEGGKLIDDLLFTVQMGLLGGGQNSPGGTLANAGPTRFRNGRSGLPSMAITGIDPFDANTQSPFGRQALFETIVHEMAHGLGFTDGTDVFNRYINEPDTAFVGPNALRAYNSIFGLNATGVPLDPGSLAHWDEFVFTTELMTPTSDPGFNQISRVTVGALEDMGYEVNYAAADPYTPIRRPLAAPINAIADGSARPGDSPAATPTTRPASPAPTTTGPAPLPPPVWAVDPVTRKLPPPPGRPRPISMADSKPFALVFGPTFGHMTARQQAVFRNLATQFAAAAAYGSVTTDSSFWTTDSDADSRRVFARAAADRW